MNYNHHIIEGFLASQSNRNSNSLRSIKCDCAVLGQYLSEQHLSVFKLADSDEFSKYASWLETSFSSRTIQRRLCTLRSVLRYCEEQGIITHKKENLSVEQNFEPVVMISSQNLSILFQYCSDIKEDDGYYLCRIKLMLLLMIIMGLKASDLCRINVSDLHEQELLFINASGKPEIRLWRKELYREQLDIYMQKREKWLKKQGAGSDKLFVDRNGKDLAPDRVQDALSNIVVICKIKEKITISSIRNRCIADYYSELPDDLLISKIFNITQQRIVELMNSCKEQ